MNIRFAPAIVLALAISAGLAPARAQDNTPADADAAFTAQPLFASSVTGYTPVNLSGQSIFGKFSATGFAVQGSLAPMTDADAASMPVQPGMQDFNAQLQLSPGVQLGFGYRTSLAGGLNIFGDQGHLLASGLFGANAATDPAYGVLTNGGNYASAKISLGEGVTFTVAHASLEPYRTAYQSYSSITSLAAVPLSLNSRHSADANVVGLNWDFADWAGIGVAASQTDEQNGVLGASGAFFGRSASGKTNALGLNVHVGFGDGWVTTVSYSEGVTQLDLKPSVALASNNGNLRSRSFGIAVAKHGLFDKNDSVGLTLSRPLQLDLGSSRGLDASQNLKIAGSPGWITASTPETDVEVGYVTTFFDGALALQANAGYQMNVTGQKGRNSATVLSRAKVNF